MNNQDIIDLFERSGIVLRGCTYEPHKVIEFVNACVDKKHSKPPEQQDIIRMAREAGIQGMCTDVICTFDELTKFAQLVAAAERAARQAAQSENGDLKERLARSGVEMHKAVRNERDACHKLRQTIKNPYAVGCVVSAHAYDMAIVDYGKAIRARGQADTNTKGTHE